MFLTLFATVFTQPTQSSISLGFPVSPCLPLGLHLAAQPPHRAVRFADTCFNYPPVLLAALHPRDA